MSHGTSASFQLRMSDSDSVSRYISLNPVTYVRLRQCLTVHQPHSNNVSRYISLSYSYVCPTPTVSHGTSASVQLRMSDPDSVSRYITLSPVTYIPLRQCLTAHQPQSNSVSRHISPVTYVRPPTVSHGTSAQSSYVSPILRQCLTAHQLSPVTYVRLRQCLMAHQPQSNSVSRHISPVTYVRPPTVSHGTSALVQLRMSDSDSVSWHISSVQLRTSDSDSVSRYISSVQSTYVDIQAGPLSLRVPRTVSLIQRVFVLVVAALGLWRD